MQVSYTTARWLAPLGFIFHFGSLVYGLFGHPNMQDIDDENQSFFSPNGNFVGMFFLIQQIFQVAYIARIFSLSMTRGETDEEEMDQVVDYVPYYSIGNFAIGIWTFFWNASYLKTANIFVLINVASQFYFLIAKLPPINTRSRSSLVTHLACKSYASMGVLDALHNSSIAYFNHAETTPVTVIALTGIGFTFGGFMCDWILGVGLVLDLMAFAAHQTGHWRMILIFYTLVTAGFVGTKNYYNIKPFSKATGRYDSIVQDET